MIGIGVITEEDVIGKDFNIANKNHRRSVSSSIISAVTQDSDNEKEDFDIDLDFDDLVEDQQSGISVGGSVLSEVKRLEKVRRLKEVKCKEQSPKQVVLPPTSKQDHTPTKIEFDFTSVGGVDTLWMAHHAGLAVTKKASRGSILRSTSFSKSRLGLAGSSFLKIPSNSNSNSKRSGDGPLIRASSNSSTNSNIGTAGASRNQSILPTTMNKKSLLNMMESHTPLPTLPSRDHIFRQDSAVESHGISSADYTNYAIGDSITTANSAATSLSPTTKLMKEMDEAINLNGSWINDDNSLTSTYVPTIQMANHIRSISDASSIIPITDPSLMENYDNYSKKWLQGTPDLNQSSIRKHLITPTTIPVKSERESKMKMKDLQHQQQSQKQQEFQQKDDLPLNTWVASCANYDGIGIEISDLLPPSPPPFSPLSSPPQGGGRKQQRRAFDDSVLVTTAINNLTNRDDSSDYFDNGKYLSIDDNDSNNGIRMIRRSLSDEVIGDMNKNHCFMNQTYNVNDQSTDSWNILSEDYSLGYGGGYGDDDFLIFGTSAKDVESMPHVLSPPLMESLSEFLPNSIIGQNFWMKYSLVRDGASLDTLLKKVRGSARTFLAVETTDGEVFGSFNSSPWGKSHGPYGTGESFLWKMMGNRLTPCQSVLDQARMESDINVYPWVLPNADVENSAEFGGIHQVQVCRSDLIAVGTGAETGFGLAIDSGLLHGTTSACSMFNSPPLSNIRQLSSSSDPFEIVNLEIWTLSPAFSEVDAEAMELRKMFLKEHTVNVY